MPTLGYQKAHAGAAAALLASCAQTIVIRYINFRWPGFLDEITTAAVEGLVDAALVWLVTALTPAGAGKS